MNSRMQVAEEVDMAVEEGEADLDITDKQDATPGVVGLNTRLLL